MPAQIIADFETRSRLDLGSTNIYKHARHSSTEVLVMSYSIDGGPVQRWHPGDPFPFADYWPDCTIVAFNSEFELVIWQNICTPRFNWPRLDPSQVDCLQARSAFAGWPRNLGDASTALGIAGVGKDAEGHKNMLTLCKPHRVKGSPIKQVGCEYFGGMFNADPAKHERNDQYCDQDVVAESLVHRMAPTLPAAEKELWLVHQEINDRGVPVDVDLCRNATKLVEREKTRLCKQLLDVTDFLVRTPNCLDKFKVWARRQGYPYHSMNDECITTYLREQQDIPPKLREALTIRKLYRDAAVSKYQGMLDHAEADSRCRAAHVFYQAGPGRFAGAGVNFLNLRRLNESETQENVDWADSISEADDSRYHSRQSLDEIYAELRLTEEIENGVISGGVIPMLGRMVRMAVCARPGNKLVVCDYAGIEYRKLHWLAGDEHTLKVIRDFDSGAGQDPYKLAAATIYNKSVTEITKAERQIGKVMVLGCGYMAGAATFSAFCESQGIDMDMERATEIVQHYRRMFPMVKKFWYDCGRCIVKAVETGRRTELRNIEFFMEGCTLNVRLPSGRLMKYYDARVVDGLYGPEIAALDQRTGGIKAVGLPIVVENIDQGSSRDLLADALIRCGYAKLPVVLHCYDSILLEVPEHDNDSAGVLGEIMSTAPVWAVGMPITGKVETSRRMT
jgi:DNA polymerase